MTTAQPFILAFCQQKGGVGKTTSAASLGAVYAQSGKRTLLVDLDPSGNLTTSMGLAPGDMPGSAADILMEEDITVEELVQKGPVKNLDVIPSTESLLQAPRFLYGQPGYEQRFRDLLSTSFFQKYDRILVDCPPMLDALAISALTAAHLAVVPTQCEYYSLQALESVFALVEVVKQNTNPNLNYRLLVTMFDRRGTFHANVLEKTREHYQDKLLNTVIGFDTRVRESQVLGRPTPVYASRSRASQQYRALAQELDTYVTG